MECASPSGGAGLSGALSTQSNLAIQLYNGAAQAAPASSADAAARTAGLQAEGKGQKLDAVC